MTEKKVEEGSISSDAIIAPDGEGFDLSDPRVQSLAIHVLFAEKVGEQPQIAVISNVESIAMQLMLTTQLSGIITEHIRRIELENRAMHGLLEMLHAQQAQSEIMKPGDPGFEMTLAIPGLGIPMGGRPN